MLGRLLESTPSVFTCQFIDRPPKGFTMAIITETALQSDWFYLSKEQLLDPAATSFFTLRDGRITSNGRVDAVGTYLIAGSKAVLTFTRKDAPDFIMTLTATSEVFNKATAILQADARYRIAGVIGLAAYQGTLVRRVTEFRTIKKP